MNIFRITSRHEGAKEIVLLLDALVGGEQFLHIHSTPLLNLILLKAMLAWDREIDNGIEQQFTKFAESIMYDLYKVTHFKVSFKVSNDESIHWDCISQKFSEFKKLCIARKSKSKKCDCFRGSLSEVQGCDCLSIKHIDKQSTLSNESISFLLARHVLNRRALNLLGLPLPARETIYSLHNSL
jgi:hypothetical protein